jgi:hypothetical protein
MLRCLPLLGSDLDDLLATPYYPSPRGTERVMPLVMFVVGTSLVVVEHRRYSPEVARRSGWRGSGCSLYSCLSVTSLCDTGYAPLYGRNG